MSMRIHRARHCLAYALSALVLLGTVAGCMPDLTRGRDFGDPPICEVHARVMVKQKVPVIASYDDLYGPEWAAAQRELSRHSDSPRTWEGDIAVHGDYALDSSARLQRGAGPVAHPEPPRHRPRQGPDQIDRHAPRASAQGRMEIRSTKHKIRNKSEFPSPNDTNRWCSAVFIGSLGFGACFGFRNSYFVLPLSRLRGSRRGPAIQSGNRMSAGGSPVAGRVKRCP
jgi:hypothetical protein